MGISYHVRGGKPLSGEVSVGGAKNAALPLIAGALLAEGETVLTNVPKLRDTLAMLAILEFLGAETSFADGTLRIRTHKVRNKPIPAQYVSTLRGSIVLLGPLLARFGVVEMSYPGGCVLGKRPVGAHIEAFVQLGAKDMSSEEVLHLQGALRPGRVILPEFSVTATENVVLAAALLPGITTVELAAAEPHVRDVEDFVAEMGAEVRGKGTHTVTVCGRKDLQPVTHHVIPDYLEAGALALTGLVTRGKVSVRGVDDSHLTSFLDVLRRGGCVWEYKPEGGVLTVDGEASQCRAMNVRTNIFPGFPTDLQAPLGVALTQASGVSRIFERLYEGRLGYLYELEKMGAHVEILNAHQALIIGPTPLKGRIVASNDIRAGAAMVLAALCADGETTITDVRYIERGYDRLDEKLEKLGARIERVEAKE
ncbi:MAG: UDP-N-acetylglucosamine 1-carboxyvinyltransferase [Candidatus Peribacteraceae bacterium]